MAIKTLDEITDIIKAGTPQWVITARKEGDRLNVHVNGKHTDKYLTHIDNIENANQLALRKKFLDENRYVLSELARPIDKVFSAKGGGNIYNLNQVSKETKLIKQLSNVRHGKSIRKWIQDIQSNKYYSDPAGLVFFEWDKNKTYPTIKSISCIQNYKSEGRELEWVLFDPIDDDNGCKLYRFVDSSKDYLIKEVEDNYTVIEDNTFNNPFDKVPAIINSELINSDLTHAESPFELIISLADHYLRTGTIKNLNEFLHGYPIFWRYMSDCKSCQGTGYIEGATCQSCNGTGKNLTKDITDIINLERPDGEDTVIAPNVAGYVTPDIASWQEMRTEQEYIKSLMTLTMWGSQMATDVNSETATAAFLNVQPVNDRLNSFSDAFEDMEKKMTDLIGKFYLTTYEGSSISYGRRFLVESPDKIWEKYDKARGNGVSKVALDYLLIQFYQSEYSNDLKSLAISLKGIKLEPFIHKTDEELVNLPVSKEDKKAKMYFNEWYKTITEIELLTKEVKNLSNEFQSYLLTKEIEDDTNV